MVHISRTIQCRKVSIKMQSLVGGEPERVLWHSLCCQVDGIKHSYLLYLVCLYLAIFGKTAN